MFNQISFGDTYLTFCGPRTSLGRGVGSGIRRLQVATLGHRSDQQIHRVPPSSGEGERRILAGSCFMSSVRDK